MRYPGGKGRGFPAIINLMPPHDTYIETHLGGGAVMRRKRPAKRSIGIDIDPAALRAWPASERPDVELVLGDAPSFLDAYDYAGGELVYCDPPFWPGARKRSRCYRHDYAERDHEVLLSILISLPCRILLSGYRSALYDKRLRDWRRIDFQAVSQAGLVLESVWINFEPGAVLHDYSFIGGNFREREAMKRRRESHIRRLLRACPTERNAILNAFAENFPEELRAAAERVE